MDLYSSRIGAQACIRVRNGYFCKWWVPERSRALSKRLYVGAVPSKSWPNLKDLDGLAID